MSQAASAAAPAKPRWVLTEALRFVLLQPRLLLRTAWLPFAIVVTATWLPVYAWPFVEPLPVYGFAGFIVEAVYYIGGIVLYGAFAIAWHRMALLGVDNYTSRVFARINRRHFWFYLFCVGVGAAFALAAEPATALYHAALPAMGEGGLTQVYSILAVRLLLQALLMLPIGFLAARLFALFPTAALSAPVSIGQAWRLSRGRSWRIFLTLAAMQLVNLFGALILVLASYQLLLLDTVPWIGNVAYTAIYRIGSDVLQTIFTFIDYALLATAASLFYARIIGPEQVAALKRQAIARG